MRDRMTRRQADIATMPDEAEAHDIVVLHRVVCCYPDYERLLTAAADHASDCWCSPPTPQLGDPDVHPPSEGRFPTDGQVFPDVRPSPGGPGRHSGGAACAPTTPTGVRSGRSSASRERVQPVDRAVGNPY